MLKDNLKNVEERVQEACDRAGRKREEVTLIAVSKTKPIEMLQEIYDENIRDFGENKVQELCDKIEKMPKDIKWHMIGHLQRNKVKYIVGQVALIHSVDSYRLAEEINIQAKKKNIIVPILVEVNIAHEESKFGISEEDAIQLVEEIAELENVRIKGLMTIAPCIYGNSVYGYDRRLRGGNRRGSYHGSCRNWNFWSTQLQQTIMHRIPVRERSRI